jgi:hypothetical protein
MAAEQPADGGKELDLPRLLRAVQVAMTDEHIDEAIIRRVVNRLIYDHPDGPTVVHRVDVDERAELRGPITINTIGQPPGPALISQLVLAHARSRPPGSQAMRIR